MSREFMFSPILATTIDQIMSFTGGIKNPDGKLFYPGNCVPVWPETREKGAGDKEDRGSERENTEREKLLKGFCRLLTGCTLQLIAI